MDALKSHLVLQGRSLPYNVDTMAAVEAIAAEQGSPSLVELLARHHSLPGHYSPPQMDLPVAGHSLGRAPWPCAGTPS